MRRKDREISNIDEIVAIIEKCKVFRIAMVDDGEPYVVPLNFGYKNVEGHLEFYFHSALEGRKIDVMRNNPKVCIEMDGKHTLAAAGDEACDYGFLYESVIGYGTVSFIEDYDEKLKGLMLLMKQQTGRDFGEEKFTENSIKRVCVGKVTIESIVGKARKV